MDSAPSRGGNHAAGGAVSCSVIQGFDGSGWIQRNQRLGIPARYNRNSGVVSVSRRGFAQPEGPDARELRQKLVEQARWQEAVGKAAR